MKKNNEIMKRYIKYMLMTGLVAMFFSCADFLDVVPDNIPTMDHAFQNRGEAEKYLVGLYSYLPTFGSSDVNPALAGAGEVWRTWAWGYVNWNGWVLATQGNIVSGPYFNQIGTYYRAFRDINIFYENIHRPYDLEEWERQQWIGEVLFLQAYYYFWLFRMYGPIPLAKDNIPMSAETDIAQRYREPADSCISYIVQLLDRAFELLPARVANEQRDLGKPCRTIVLAVKAQVLTYAASPLYNGNPEVADYMDNRGIPLFSQKYEPERWERAAAALKAAIDAAHNANHELYDFRRAPTSILQATLLSEETILNMQVRGAVTEKWNSEIIWGDPRGCALQSPCFPAFNILHYANFGANYAPPMHIVESFYTKNGLPIKEDKDWQYVDPYSLKIAQWEDRQYIHVDDTTLALNYNREPRFYASLSFDHGTFYGNGRETEDNIEDEGTMWTTDYNRLSSTNKGSGTGYLCKKFVHFKSTVADNSASPIYTTYPFPIIRLADLYLMYAEVLNEVKSAPDAEVYEYIDRVRNRTGLEGVVDTWQKYALEAYKKRPADKDEMRKIIHKERMNELMFEGVLYWDLRRWKTAPEYYNKTMISTIFLYLPDFGGYDILTVTPTEMSQPWKLHRYFWPIPLSSILIDRKLIQSPGY
jgi:hypothetical protein